MRFAHFSDPHLPLPPGLPRPLRLLAGKRLLGYLSWLRNRRYRHDPLVLRALTEDVATHAPDHWLVTGDLVNLALPAEFEAARRWLEGLGPTDAITVIPGNHDALAAVPAAVALEQWRPWLTGDAAEDTAGGDFPFVRVRGPVAFVCLSSAEPTPPFLATGRLGEAQVARLAEALAHLGARGLFRVVAVHHPAEDGTVGRRRALRDAEALREAIAGSGAELVLHGHAHHPHLGHILGPHGPVPVSGVPSASAGRGRQGHHARWHLHTVERSGDGWMLHTTVRGLGPDGRFTTEGHWHTHLPAG